MEIKLESVELRERIKKAKALVERIGTAPMAVTDRTVPTVPYVIVKVRPGYCQDGSPELELALAEIVAEKWWSLLPQAMERLELKVRRAAIRDHERLTLAAAGIVRELQEPQLEVVGGITPNEE